MFRVETRQSGFQAACRTLDLIFHNTVRSVRKGHANAFMGLLNNILQTLIFFAVFYALFALLGMRGAAVRGDYVLYLMSGIFIFMVNTKTMGAVAGSENSAAAIMLHAPMTTAVAIASAALASLYTQALSIVAILGVYHLAVTPVEIHDPIGFLGLFMLAWFSGACIGLVVLAATPWAPGIAGVLTAIYARSNLIFSGKMFVANTLGYTALKFFDWNPLFHIIDQARGAMFINYYPHNSSVSYPLYVSLALLMIGLMGEFYTRRHVSPSWTAGK
ncbi:MAG TPA: ABC transporter permease [Albidovulum sp.]|uniref:ABC transporter permease n=1 Tax=Albidovulum sp. TaxID=1872424 RepID=UPI002B7B9945|nr:ABC transporter permease [Albidovulum sp.]